jgi:hypothetical protein
MLTMKKLISATLVISLTISLVSCQKFEEGRNFRLRTVKQMLCKKSWTLFGSFFEQGNPSEKELSVFNVKFEKDGTCTYQISIDRGSEDEQNEPDYVPYAGFYEYTEETVFTSTWRFDENDKSIVYIDFEGNEEKFTINLMDKLSLYLKINVKSNTLTEVIQFHSSDESFW